MKPYIKPPEPDWTPGEQLRFLAELLRACSMQAGTLQHRRGVKPSVLEMINRVIKKLDYCEKECTAGHIKPGTEGAAATYFDNEGALFWELGNELRKMDDRRNGLAMLFAYNAGLVMKSEDMPRLRKANRVKSPTKQAA